MSNEKREVPESMSERMKHLMDEQAELELKIVKLEAEKSALEQQLEEVRTRTKALIRSLF